METIQIRGMLSFAEKLINNSYTYDTPNIRWIIYNYIYSTKIKKTIPIHFNFDLCRKHHLAYIPVSLPSLQFLEA